VHPDIGGNNYSATGVAVSAPAVLALEDGSVFRGDSVGADGGAVGEVVCRQLVTLTYPHIGNTGATPEDYESSEVFASGLIIRDLPLLHSNWRARETLPGFLRRENVVAISDIDTRRLTRIIREKGALAGCVMTGTDEPSRALEEACGFPGLKGMDLARVVSVDKPYDWKDSVWRHAQDGSGGRPLPVRHVVAYDFGIKRNILRLLVAHGCQVTVVPAQTPAEEVLLMGPDGVFLSNGPGDPEPCEYAIEATREFLNKKIPLFGICLGHQILGLAVGARTVKMKFGHHGANHPVQDLDSGRVMISSQNHGFAVDETSLPYNARTTHRSLFDGSLQGIELTDTPAFSFQGHPEASPGPHDLSDLFERFVGMMG
jgi:carbamoyl-phosphate synthase small subunit